MFKHIIIVLCYLPRSQSELLNLEVSFLSALKFNISFQLQPHDSSQAAPLAFLPHTLSKHTNIWLFQFLGSHPSSCPNESPQAQLPSYFLCVEAANDSPLLAGTLSTSTAHLGIINGELLKLRSTLGEPCPREKEDT